MAESIDSAEVARTRPSNKHLVGISAGVPDVLADREVQSPIGGIAYRLHSIEGSRYGVSVLGCTTNEYGEGTSCKSAIVNPVGYQKIDISVVEDPAAGKSC